MQGNELLLKDLCMRIPYGPTIQCCGGIYEKLISINSGGLVNNDYDLDEVKPCLIPLSKAPKEMIARCKQLFTNFSIDFFYTLFNYYHPTLIISILNEYHIDYNNFIEQGLAVDASELNIY